MELGAHDAASRLRVAHVWSRPMDGTLSVSELFEAIEATLLPTIKPRDPVTLGRPRVGVSCAAAQLSLKGVVEITPRFETAFRAGVPLCLN